MLIISILRGTSAELNNLFFYLLAGLSASSSLAISIPVFPEHFVCNAVHRQVVYITEGIDGLLHTGVGIGSNGSCHECTIDRLEILHQEMLDNSLAILVQVISEQVVDVDLRTLLNIVYR